MIAKTLLAYESSDESLLTKLKESLAPLQWKGIITIYDCEINSSSRAKELLGTADIILLLVSAQFLNTDYCYSAEMAEAIERHKQGKIRVIPVILRPAYWEKTVFSMLQAVPTKKAITLWEDKNVAFREVVSAVEAIATEVSKDTSQAPTSQFTLQAHLDLLKQGVKVWNQWKQEHYEIQPSFQEANLSSFDLSGADLRGANLNSADLRGASMSDIKLSDSDLSNTNLNDANLTGADLVGSNLVGANLRGVNLTKANLSLANLSETNLNEALLSVTVF